MAGDPGLLIIGQGPAGTAAAKAFREKDPDTPVTLVSMEKYACYSRPRLPEVISSGLQPEQICLYPNAWYAEHRLSMRLDEKAVALDLAAKKVRTDKGNLLSYSRLILAMGAEAMLPPIPGITSPHVYVLRTFEDALALRSRAQGRKNAILIGGGLLGLEAGYALTRLGLAVVVVEIVPRLLPRQLDEEGSGVLEKLMLQRGFEFILGAKVEAIESTGEEVKVHLPGGVKLTGDLALMSAGITPCVELVKPTDIVLGRTGIQVDDELRTNHPEVFAAGDVAEWKGQIAGLWSVAQAMGRVAGQNAANGHASYAGTVPSTKLKVAGIDLWSQGEIDPAGAMIEARRDPAGGYLLKLFLKDQRVVGSIQIGDTRQTQKLKTLIERKISVAGFEDRIMDPDFDFNQIPQFKE